MQTAPATAPCRSLLASPRAPSPSLPPCCRPLGPSSRQAEAGASWQPGASMSGARDIVAKDRGAKPLSEETASGSQTPRQGGRHSGFKVSSKRPTHSERPERVCRGKGQRDFAVAPGSLVISAAMAGTGSPARPIAKGTARTASPAPTQAAAGCIGTIW